MPIQEAERKLRDKAATQLITMGLEPGETLYTISNTRGNQRARGYVLVYWVSPSRRIENITPLVADLLYRRRTGTGALLIHIHKMEPALEIVREIGHSLHSNVNAFQHQPLVSAPV